MQILGLSLLDFIGSTISIFSVFCMLKKNIMYWYSAIICNILWFIVFINKSLYLSSALQITYILFSLYGILRWRYNKKNKKLNSFIDNLGLMISLIIISFAFVNSSFQNIYDVIEILAVILLITANLLTAKEKSYCWYFWIIGDLLYSLFLFHEKVFGFFIIQIIFVFLSFWGLYEWKKKLQSIPH